MYLFLYFCKEFLFLSIIVSPCRLLFFVFIYLPLDMCSYLLEVFSVYLRKLYA